MHILTKCTVQETKLCKCIKAFCVGGKITIWLPFETYLGFQMAIINSPLQVATFCGHDNNPSGFLKKRRVSRLAGGLLASYKGPCSVEFVNISLKLGHVKVLRQDLQI
jgi:hypothetical protein